MRLVRTGWKHEATPAAELLARDTRPPILYLRSFADDDQLVVARGRISTRLVSWISPWTAISLEQEMVMLLGHLGPVVAIGKPGEALPELGAARLYESDDLWRAAVAGLMTRARLVLIRTGATPNLWWEVEQALARLPPRRVVLVTLGAGPEAASFDRRFEAAFGAPVRPAPRAQHAAVRLFRRLFPIDRMPLGKIIYFDEHGTARVQPILMRIRWTGYLLFALRPYGDSLASAMEVVLQALGQRGARRRSQTIAVLLAMSVGMIGVHQFYVGNRRRGLWYIGLSPLLIPLVLAWIDAVRFALAAPDEFQQKHVRRPHGVADGSHAG